MVARLDEVRELRNKLLEHLERRWRWDAAKAEEAKAVKK
jgi:hypothetical protein